MKSDRRNISQPPDWWSVWEAAAQQQGLDLSSWIGEQVNKSLPRSVRKTLSERVGRGKPKKETKGK